MSERKEQRRGLGRGLSALMADIEPPKPEVSTGGNATRADRTLPIEQIYANPDQPRRQFDASQLEELAASIKSKGIIQPLIVRPKNGAQSEYEIVAGERRWRAAQAAGLHDVPVVIREFSDEDVLEIAIIENIQRADLNAIEEAAGYEQLMTRFGHTQEKLAQALGKSRSHIANLLRLLNLPIPVKELVQDGKLSAGHARALVTSPDPVAMAKDIVAKGLSVRETERLVKSALDPKKERPAKPRADQMSFDKDADTKALEGDLSAAVGMKVAINHNQGSENGTVSIRYETLEQLDALCMLLSNGR
jgi:ParB family chromosome partitioning protein